MHKNNFHARLHIFVDIRDFHHCIHCDLKESKNSKFSLRDSQANNKRVIFFYGDNMTEDDIFFGHLDCLELSSKAPFFFFFFFSSNGITDINFT